MADALAPELNPLDQIQFVDDHRVALMAGDYRIDLQQNVFENGTLRGATPETAFVQTGCFTVLGEKYGLAPQAIHAVFPPPGSRGHYWRDLPHVILNRSTLPWERTLLKRGDDARKDPPWLVLLLFNEDDPPPQTQVVKLNQIRQAKGAQDFPYIQSESGQQDEDRVMFIAVAADLLNKLLPPTFDYTCHVRRRLAYLAGPQVEAADDNSLIESLRTILRDRNFALSDTATIAAVSSENLEAWRVRDLANQTDYEIRQDANDSTKYTFYRVDHETAVVLGNRLPTPGKKHTAHLVSLEGCYGGTPAAYQLDPQQGQGAKQIPLISLKSWQFFCEDESKTFKWIMQSLNSNTIQVSDGKLDRIAFPDATVVTANNGAQTLMSGDRLVGKIISGNWKQASFIKNGEVLDASNRPLATVNGKMLNLNDEVSSDFRLPIPANLDNATAKRFMASGFVPLPHHFRQGDRSVSWYHGPLMPSPPQVPQQVDHSTEAGAPLSARAADELLFFDQTTGLFDVSYAAAWELGRMLMLKNTSLALQLFNWKRSQAHQQHAARYYTDYAYGLPLKLAQTANAPALPKKIVDWLDDLALLKQVPFHYLAPDEQLLPPESLRFFVIDAFWIECLRDGAFSVGRVSAREQERDKALKLPTPTPPASGFLLRSEAVSGWPTMQVAGYAEIPGKDLENPALQGYTPLTILRQEKLSKNVLLCLFAGQVQVIDFRLPPEILHFGFDLVNQPDADHPTAMSNLCKLMRDEKGNDIQPPLSLPWLHADLQVVDLAGLAQSMKGKAPASLLQSVVDASGDNFGPGLFAFEMVAGVDLIRFDRQPQPGR